MKNNIFIKSGYNFFKSMLSIEKIVDFAVENNLKNIAIIETNYLFGAYHFIKYALSKEVTPIIGLELKKLNKILIAKNYLGFKVISQISSQIESINFNDLEFNPNDVLVIEEENLKFATYLNQEEFSTFKIFKMINGKEVNENEVSLNEGTETFSPSQLELLEQIQQVNFTFELDLKKYSETLNFNQNANIELKNMLENSFKDFVKNNKDIDINLYIQRLTFELKVITEMNFSNYFLIVTDYVRWAKSQNIFVGPGRGSAPGSLVSFLLGITTIDPIKNNLLFERFLNPSRVNVPDIDIDFQDDRREEVLNYITNKYNKENVAQIITFQTFQTKNTIKDVSRMYNIEFKLVNNFTKLFNDKISLDSNLKKREIKNFIKLNPIFDEILKHSKNIIGLPRQISTHAAGVLISSEPIKNIVPIVQNFMGLNQTQFSMNYLEENGLIKFDLLGLRNLTTFKNVVNLVKERQEKQIHFINDKFLDEEVFNLLSNGKTLGIFQLESLGMKQVIEKVGVNHFEDIVSIISLFRPGPMNNIDSFANRKHGKEKIKYLDASLESILKNTYGIIVYQEQILEIANKFANFSLIEADNLRRAIGKKDVDKMSEYKEKFILSAISNEKEQKIAEEVYDLIFEFANYGFNRSHAFSYAIISYNFAYLKKYFPLEFAINYFASIEKDSQKIVEYLKENPQIKILPPSINNSNTRFSLEDNYIRMGFSSILGMGVEIISKILKSKEEANGKFDNYFSCLAILVSQKVTNKQIEVLIKVGAFDEFGFSRESMINSLEKVIKFAKLLLNKEGKVDLTIFDTDDFPSIEHIVDTKNAEYEEKLLGLIISK